MCRIYFKAIQRGKGLGGKDDIDLMLIITEAADGYVEFIIPFSLWLYMFEFFHNPNLKQHDPRGQDCVLFPSTQCIFSNSPKRMNE